MAQDQWHIVLKGQDGKASLSSCLSPKKIGKNDVTLSHPNWRRRLASEGLTGKTRSAANTTHLTKRSVCPHTLSRRGGCWRCCLALEGPIWASCLGSITGCTETKLMIWERERNRNPENMLRGWSQQDRASLYLRRSSLFASTHGSTVCLW